MFFSAIFARNELILISLLKIIRRFLLISLVLCFIFEKIK
ncbi:hypothetical protein PROVRETT_05349 [Providencia rettgeri DSM 1131]|nr:hypothetical protein PROVRETT_05349 [Providencia rettgeri DSM 1131]